MTRINQALEELSQARGRPVGRFTVVEDLQGLTRQHIAPSMARKLLHLSMPHVAWLCKLRAFSHGCIILKGVVSHQRKTLQCIKSNV